MQAKSLVPCDHLCGCCSSASQSERGAAGLSRREFLAGAGALGASGLVLPRLSLSAVSPGEASAARPVSKVPLRVQPVLTYRILQRKQATSWREYGAVQTEADVSPEKERISRELAEMASSSQLPLEILPLKTVENPEQAGSVAQGNHDVLIVYAAGGSERTLAALTLPDKWNLMFLRHRSGPVYRWYESNQPRFLRKAVDEYGQAGMAGMGVEDLVVDSQAEILMRLRALYGLKNTLGKRIVAVGEPGGWGPARQHAPLRSRELWKLDIVNVPYPDLGERIKRARQDEALVGRCRADADTYLKQKGVSLETTREFVYNAFVLTAVFRSLMAEAQTDAITINQCMSTIMPIAETTACVPLSLLNDEGYLAFCESDFVVIPSGILLHYISGKPVFLNNPTYPHDGMVTLMHCTAPRKMDGNHPEGARILTHFESDYGAAPKVDMRKGQKITVLDPDFASRRWLGFEGEIVDNPFLAFCRSQIDVRINGNCDRLLEEMRGFHWMVSYGNYLRETGYALKKVGVDWVNLS